MTGSVLALDADGVLLSYFDGLFAFLRNRGEVPACDPAEVDDWNYERAFPDWKSDERLQAILDFSLSPGFSDIPMMPGAIEAISVIRAAAPNLRIVAITCAGVSPQTIAMRKSNLADFPFDEIHVLPLNASKASRLAKLPAGSIFVDDLPENIEAAERAGVKAFIFRQPYNRDFMHDREIGDWRSGADILLDALGVERMAELSP